MTLAKNLLVLCAAFGGASSLFADTTVTFDEFGPQPDEFLDALPLTTAYNYLGLTFSGGGAILNQNGNFGVPALSGVNFLAFNQNAGVTNSDGSAPTGPETITFATPVTSVSIWGGSGNPVNFSLDAFDAGGNFLSGVSSSAAGGYVDLAVSGPDISSITLTGSGPTFVFDNLTFSGSPAGVPDNGSTWFALGIGVLGLIGLRRLTSSQQSA